MSPRRSLALPQQAPSPPVLQKWEYARLEVARLHPGSRQLLLVTSCRPRLDSISQEAVPQSRWGQARQIPSSPLRADV